MSKERYLKPQITSEVLEPGALGGGGSPTGCEDELLKAIEQTLLGNCSCEPG